jgi:hypothetical protein
VREDRNILTHSLCKFIDQAVAEFRIIIYAQDLNFNLQKHLKNAVISETSGRIVLVAQPLHFM